MNLAELKRRGFIKPIPIDNVQIAELMKISERDVELAEELMQKSCDGALNLAYNAMLQAARALMFSYGYRPDSEYHHKATIEFIFAVFDNKHKSLAETLDRIRSKRNVATYERTGAISKFEAEYALKGAQEFIDVVKNKLNKRNHQ
ncbi:MAG: HEPN domain-containing protein [Candidatus Micrarchaeota archaeon]